MWRRAKEKGQGGGGLWQPNRFRMDSTDGNDSEEEEEADQADGGYDNKEERKDAVKRRRLLQR